MNDYALVVGIETYTLACAPALQGPSLNALRFALWLAKTGVLPKNIILFHNKSKAWQGDLEKRYHAVLQELQALGVQPRENPGYCEIEKAWREELLQGPADEKATLWFYWSGHGVAFDSEKEALLCSDTHYGDPAFFYVSELTKSFLSEAYGRFQTQRIVMDACAEPVTYEYFNTKAIRDPLRFKPETGRDQTVWNAVALGEKAEAHEGGSLFTSVLLEQLQQQGGWPEDMQSFYKTMEKAVGDVGQDPSKRPRLKIVSRYYEDSNFQDYGGRAAECREILEMLAACKIPYEQYQPLYQRTIGNLAPDDVMSNASTLTGMIRVLLDLHAEVEFGNVSRALVEFLSRVVRDFPTRAGPVRKWIESRVPVGGRETAVTALAKEKPDLALAVMLIESPSQNGFPVQLSACLADAGFSRLVKRWPAAESRTLEGLEAAVYEVLFEARTLAVRQDVKLTVHIYANPPLLGLPYHALRFNPANKKDARVFSQFHPLVLRSRARLWRDDPFYDIDAWRQKLKTLRDRQGCEISFHPALGWNDTIQDEFAKVDGLLLIRDVVGPVRSEQEVLEAALQCGLPLLSWRVEAPESWDDFEQKLKGVFQTFPKVGQAPQQFRDVRRVEAWARQTALLWDDDDNEPLRAFLGEEPI